MNTRKCILALTLVLLAAPLAPAPGRACDEGGTGEEGRIIVREGAWLDSELDSTWTALEPGAYLLRLRRPTGAWVVETWYYRLPSDPTRVLTHEELVALREQGRIEPWDEPTTVVDQVLVYAQGEAQAARLARAMRPRQAPVRVVEAVIEYALHQGDEEGC